MRRTLCVLAGLATALAAASATHAQIKPITSSQVPSKPEALGSQAIDAGDYVYVSGQSPHRADGSTPSSFADQARQCLDNIKALVEAAGLTKDNIVYVQVYMDDTTKYAELNQAFAAYFPKDPPARGILGVAANPDSSIQITAMAVRDLTGKKAVTPPNYKPNKAFSWGVLTHDRLFISNMQGIDFVTGKIPSDPGEQVNLALDGLKAVAESAGLTLANMVFVNPYLTDEIPHGVMNKLYAARFEFGNTPGRATIEATSLPEGAHIAYTGIAVRDISQRQSIRPKNMPPSPTASPCVFAGDTLYCSAKSGFIPGPNLGMFIQDVPNQTRQSMRNQLDNLEEADMKYDQAVSTVIYLDNLSETSDFAAIYKKFFGKVLPATTVVQQMKPVDRKPDAEGHVPEVEQFSIFAIRSHPKQ
ncbi:MAG TPA: RidA family protein [Candidatus Eremiobacteraceae bacterium]|jgi:reactive intermediate/imine deaminase|nr:RidA family protein [Candidatus Eremiobacteraceae bacterium]